MTIDVSDAIDSDTAVSLEVKRTPPGAYISGIYSKGVGTVFNTLISVQSPTPAEVKMLPEGERLKDIKKFISKAELFVDNDRNNTLADIITYRGFDYKLIKVSDYQFYGYSRAFGARVG